LKTASEATHEQLNKKFYTECQQYYKYLKDICPLCDGSGIHTTDRGTFIDCECTKTFIKNKEYVNAGIPITFLVDDSTDLSKLLTPECFEKFQRLIPFITSNNSILNGVSIFVHNKIKSDHSSQYLANLIAKSLLDCERDTFVINSFEIIDSFFNFKQDSKDLEILMSVDNLIINNFGMENSKHLNDEESFIYSNFIRLLGNRKSKNLTTIICGELTLEEVSKNYAKGLINTLVVDYLKFEVECSEKKKSALKELQDSSPESVDIFSDSKVKIEKTTKNVVNNRGRTLR